MLHKQTNIQCFYKKLSINLSKVKDCLDIIYTPLSPAGLVRQIPCTLLNIFVFLKKKNSYISPNSIVSKDLIDLIAELRVKNTLNYPIFPPCNCNYCKKKRTWNYHSKNHKKVWTWKRKIFHSCGCGYAQYCVPSFSDYL